jgi:hypothetical protein
LDLTRKTQPPLAEASVANIETGFIESTVDFTTASGWLERLVRCHGFLPKSTERKSGEK